MEYEARHEPRLEEKDEAGVAVILASAAPKQPPDDGRLDISSQSTASLYRGARAQGTGMRYSELHSSLVGTSQP